MDDGSPTSCASMPRAFGFDCWLVSERWISVSNCGVNGVVCTQALRLLPIVPSQTIVFGRALLRPGISRKSFRTLEWNTASGGNMPDGKRKPKPKKPVWDSAGMSPQAKAHFDKYVRWIKDDMSDIETTPLVILVWGPGESGGDIFQKRVQIRQMLRERGDVALFSEELDEACKGFAGSSRAKELIQAHRADFIIVLYSSPGSIAEVHDFGGFLKVLGTKMLVFVDSRHINGYGYTGLLSELKAEFNNVHHYKYPEDIAECHLMAAVDEKLGRLRIAKWWAAQSGNKL